MQVLFINYATYTGNSGVHIHFLANALSSLGVHCTVSLPVMPRSSGYFGVGKYALQTWAQCLWSACKGEQCDILHVWTPREGVRLLSSVLRWLMRLRAFGVGPTLVVHLEDNEALLVTHSAEKKWRLGSVFDFLFETHPDRGPVFVEAADAVTVVIPSLLSFVGSEKARIVLMPGCEDEFFTLPHPWNRKAGESSVRQQLSLDNAATILTYTGAVQRHNLQEMEDLFLALPLLHEAGCDVRCLHCGEVTVPLSHEAALAYESYVIAAPTIKPVDFPHWLEAADILVQPGCSSAYNDFRLPSKLPMYLASGRPVVLPRTNLGLELEDEKNCLHLGAATPLDIAQKILRLVKNPELTRKIGSGGREFAQLHCHWGRTAQGLRTFYESVIGGLS